MKGKKIILAIGIPLAAFTGVILFRNYIPYAPWLTETLGLKDIAPTAEQLSYQIQTDPLGAVRTGGIVGTVVGIATKLTSFVGGKINVFIKGVKDTKNGLSDVKDQVNDGFRGVVGGLDQVKTDLTNKITDVTSEFTTLKTGVTEQISGVKTAVENSVGDIQELKADAVRTLSTANANKDELLNLKNQLVEQKQLVESQINSLLEKIKDPLHSYQ